MALTVTTDSVWVGAGDRKVVEGSLTFDNNYLTGGTAYTGATFGLDLALTSLWVQPLNATATRLVVNDVANKKLKVYTALSTEASNASDQSTISVRFRATGKGQNVG